MSQLKELDNEDISIENAVTSAESLVAISTGFSLGSRVFQASAPHFQLLGFLRIGTTNCLCY